MLRRLLLGARFDDFCSYRYIRLKFRAHQCCNVVDRQHKSTRNRLKNPNASDDDTHIVKMNATPPPEVEKMVTNRRCRERKKNNDPRYSSGRVAKFEKLAQRLRGSHDEPGARTPPPPPRN